MQEILTTSFGNALYTRKLLSSADRLWTCLFQQGKAVERISGQKSASTSVCGRHFHSNGADSTRRKHSTLQSRRHQAGRQFFTTGGFDQNTLQKREGGGGEINMA